MRSPGPVLLRRYRCGPCAALGRGVSSVPLGSRPVASCDAGPGSASAKSVWGHLAYVILVMSLIVWLPGPLRGEEKPLLSIQPGARWWLSRGEASWQISDSGVSGEVFVGVTSELEFKKVDGILYSLSAEIAPLRGVSLDFSYGFGRTDGGNGRDTDRFVFPTSGTFSESISQIDGRIRLWGINLYLHLLPVRPVSKRDSGSLDLFLGYQEYQDHLLLREGVQTVAPGCPTCLGPFPHLASTYDFEWRGVRLGARGELPLPYHFSLKGSVALFPYLFYKGEAFWNLRTDFRRQPPNFVHKAEGGFGLDVGASFSFVPCESFQTEVGYRLLHLRVTDGTDTTFLRDGTVGEAVLDEVITTRHGVLFTLTVFL